MQQPFSPLARVTLSGLAALTLFAVPAHAATIPSDDFSLEVTPSPLVTTVKPGQVSTLELKIRNAGSKTEDLSIEARDFTIDKNTSQITPGTSTPPDLASWVKFSQPRFTVKAGEWATQQIAVALPEAAGFSYPFAVVVKRANEPTTPVSGNRLRGSVAVFALVNVDRPGATRTLRIEGLSSAQGIYEFLPATINVKLKNTGNSIVQPYGNLFIQRGSDDTNPLKVLPVNDAKSYILPGATREISATWAEGFPRYETSAPDASGKTNQNLTWNWGNAGMFRFGRYTAKVIAVYNDGTRDVPLVGEVSFWVIPWRILLGAFVVLLVFAFGLWAIVRRFVQRIKGRGTKRPHP